MPLFSRLDRTDVEALYVFLKSMPKVKRPNTPGGQPLRRARPGDPADVLFVSVGCASCHGESGPHRDKLVGALAKTDAEIAEWILNPQAKRPGSPMPSFEGVLDREQAEALARYVKSLLPRAEARR
jgi:cytochrome c553